MEQQKLPKKMFLHIVQELRELIAQKNIQPGDKLPSERVLSEQLQVSRSAVREALRSLELLGLIESRHGGGTFLKAVQHHQLVEILSSFILQESNSLEDVEATRQMHEKEAIRLICADVKLAQLPVWDGYFFNIELQQDVVREHILREIMIACGNRLALKIWLQLLAYSTESLKKHVTVAEKQAIQTLLKSLQLQYENEAIKAYKQWMKLLK